MSAERMERVRARMADLGVEALLLSLGADLPWLTGYEAMPLERLTMLALPADGHATLVVPRLEAAIPRAIWRPASDVTGPLRAVKDDHEVAALRRAAAAADRVAVDLVGG